jgi:putative NADH-flavin reductase
MQITVFGATGQVGSRVVVEALVRGHEVTAVARDPSRQSELSDVVELSRGDIADVDDVIALTDGRDMVINATRSETRVDAVHGTREFMRGLATTGVRSLIVGGAATLTVPGTSGRTVLDDARYLSPSFRPVGEVSRDQYRTCLAEKTVDWAYLSPPANLFPGTRTGNYRIGTDELLLDADGQSRISMEDLAVVILDEAECPRHHRARFTAAY